MLILALELDKVYMRLSYALYMQYRAVDIYIFFCSESSTAMAGRPSCIYKDERQRILKDYDCANFPTGCGL